MFPTYSDLWTGKMAVSFQRKNTHVWHIMNILITNVHKHVLLQHKN